MPGVKTAISLNEELFERVNKLAHEMHISRSRLFTLAVNDYFKKYENQKMLAQLNKVYGEHPTDEEEKVSKSMRSKQSNIVEQESW